MDRVIALVLLLALSSACAVAIPSPSVDTLQEWVNLNKFTPLILWPEPEGSKLMGPPHYGATRSQEYVWLWYGEGFIASGIEPPLYMLYESNAPLPVGQAFLTDYVVSKVTIVHTPMTLNGESVLVEIRENPVIPDSGVAIFQLGNTHVAYHWRHMLKAKALGVLERHLTPVRYDATIISSFDKLLVERFPMPTRDGIKH